MNPLIVSFMTLRKIIGWLGISMVITLPLMAWFRDGSGLLPSMSAYYYSSARDLFVGNLAAIGLFLGIYNGYDWRDRLASGIAGAASSGIAMFPMAPDGASGWAMWAGYAHFACALAFFGALAWFCLVLFPKTSGDPTPEKLMRNEVYKTCGWVILIGIVTLTMAASMEHHSRLVFWIEAAMIGAFGYSWLVKGEALLADQVA